MTCSGLASAAPSATSITTPSVASAAFSEIIASVTPLSRRSAPPASSASRRLRTPTPAGAASESSEHKDAVHQHKLRRAIDGDCLQRHLRALERRCIGLCRERPDLAHQARAGRYISIPRPGGAAGLRAHRPRTPAVGSRRPRPRRAAGRARRKIRSLPRGRSRSLPKQRSCKIRFRQAASSNCA